jgi:hypothetical protein
MVDGLDWFVFKVAGEIVHQFAWVGSGVARSA